jgi:hypothetical protein
MTPEEKKKLYEIIGAIVGVGMVLLVGYIIITYQQSQVLKLCENITNCTIMAIN